MRDGCGTQWLGAWEPGKQYAWPTEGLPDQQVHQVWTGQLQQTLHLKSNQISPPGASPVLAVVIKEQHLQRPQTMHEFDVC